MAAKKKEVKKFTKKPVKKPAPHEKAKNPDVQQLREELFKEKVVDTIEHDVVEVSAESSKTEIKEDGHNKKDEEEGSVVQEAEEELLAVEAKIKEEKPSPEDDQPLAEKEGELEGVGGLEENAVGLPEEKLDEKTFGIPQKKERSSKKSLLVLGVIFLFIGAILGIFIFSSLQFFGAKIVPEREEITPVPTEEPTVTPEPEISFDSYQLQVLNGSGVSGQAAQTAQLLEDKLGFSSSNVDTGNAPDNVEKTTVELKSSVPPEVFDKIKEILTGLTVVLGDPLADDSNYDVVVTLGQQD